MPELVFGHLLTSSNFDDNEKKITGGRNGLGAKLTNIFSKRFKIETQDLSVNKRLTIEWTDNMNVKSDVIIQEVLKSNVKSKSKMDEEEEREQDMNEDYTVVTFEPDFKRFDIKEFSGDMISIMEKRVYDLGGILGGKVRVYLNGKKIKISSWDKYVDYYLGEEDKEKKQNRRVRLIKNSRWEIMIGLSSEMVFK